MTSRNGRVVLLSNPVAGSGDAALHAARAVARLHQLGLEVEHIAGVSRAHALELATTAVATRPEAFLVAGGDGGVSVAVQALAGTDVPLGIIPTGTGNDTARTLGIPLDDVTRAADVAAAGRSRVFDLGHVTLADGTERYFIGVVGADYASDVLALSHRLPWPVPDSGRFLASTLLASWRLRAHRFSILTGDGRDLSGKYHIAAVGNLRAYGGGMTICPGADAHDGLLDLTLMRRTALPHVRLAPYLRQAYTGGVVPDETVEFHRAASFTLSAPGRELFADGDPVGPLPAEIRSVPGALRVIVP